jgi:putative NADH-flavin reductase
MKISVLGATGPSGLQTVLEALDRGYDVVALVRNPDKLTVKNDKLQVTTGTVQGTFFSLGCMPNMKIVFLY